jgi:hypothetical protein
MPWQGVFLAFAALILAVLLVLPWMRLPAPVSRAELQQNMGTVVLGALRDPSFALIFLGFFSCGYQLAFITAHFPAFVAEVCGPIMLGSVLHAMGITTTGALGTVAISIIGLGGRHHPVDHPDPQRLIGRDAVRAGQDDLFGNLGADKPGQDHDDNTGTELQFGLAEHRRVRRDRQVAGQRQFARPREAVAIDRRDGRLGQVPEPHDGVEVLAQDAPPRVDASRPPLHLLLEVKSRRESGTCAGDDQDADRIVGLGPVQSVTDLIEHRLVERVQTLWPVQDQPSDGAMGFELDCAVGHDCYRGSRYWGVPGFTSLHSLCSSGRKAWSAGMVLTSL